MFFFFGPRRLSMCRWRVCVQGYWLQFSFDFRTAWPSHVCASSLTTAATRRSRASRVLHSLAPEIWAVEQPDPWQCCRLLDPLPARGAQRAPGQKPTRPTADPPKVHASQKRAHPKPIKNEGHQKRSNTITPKPSRPERQQNRSKTCAFLTMAQSQGHR